VRDLYGFFYLLGNGRPQEAAEEIERAVEQDPLNVLFRTHWAVCLIAAGRKTEGRAELRQVLELDENFLPALITIGASHALRGELAEALASAEKAYATAPQAPSVMGLLAGVLALSGDAGRAEAFLEKLRPGRAYGSPRALGTFHILCGEVEKAADWAEKVIDQRDPLALLFTCGPLGTALRSSVRWPGLAKMMNLPEAK